MDHVLFYGILTVSIVFGALIYHANMAEEESGALAVTPARVKAPAFQKPLWRVLIEPETALAATAALVCALILSVR
jgi:hypothetical protein